MEGRMLKVRVEVRERREALHNFWNHIHFHPTDAIEDRWGRQILDQVSEDGAARYVRIYAMLEDVVTRDSQGNLQYDFRETDRRIDYLVEKGFGLLICFNFLPQVIAADPECVSWLARYKGKHINTSKPKDYEEWQEICRIYTEHLKVRYGEERLGTWYIHCWNEPDFPDYFLSSLEREGHMEEAAMEYTRLYDHFVCGVAKACGKVKVGGPSAALSNRFIRLFLTHVKTGINWATGMRGSRLDFLSIHTYGAFPKDLAGGRPIRVEDTCERVMELEALAKECGFDHLEIVADEWGLSTEGFTDTEKYPALEFRNTEKYAAAYAHLIHYYISRRVPLSMQMICLSGQHNLKREFHGYRSFFTLHGFPKPIYNAYALCAKLGERRLDCTVERGDREREDSAEKTFVTERDGSIIGAVPTIDPDGRMAVLLYRFQPDLCGEKKRADLSQARLLHLEAEGLKGVYRIRHYRIDRDHCNSYRAWQRLGRPENPDQETAEMISREGSLRLWYPEERTDIQGIWRTDVVLPVDGVSVVELIPEALI